MGLGLWPRPPCSRKNVEDVGYGFMRGKFFSLREEILVSSDHGTSGWSSTHILDTPCSSKWFVSYILRKAAECCLILCHSGPSREHWAVTRGPAFCCTPSWTWSSSKVRDPGPGPRGEFFELRWSRNGMSIHVVSPALLTGFLLLQPIQLRCI